MSAPVAPPPGAVTIRAQHESVSRLVNCVLREIGPAPQGPGPVRLATRAGDRALVVAVEHHSVTGQHVLAPEVLLEESGRRRPAGHEEAVAVLLAVVAEAAPGGGSDDGGRAARLTRQILDSTARTARYLAAPSSPAASTRAAEQSVRLGHPFHPVPKALELVGPLATAGADEALLERSAPELGTAFRLPHLAIDPALVAERLDGPGPWLPADAEAAAPAGWPVVPVLPVQLAHLRARPETARLLADGALVELGERGAPVYPTSSVRTVCDPAFPTMWKLPLHVRITNFVRTVPPEHAERAHDASRVVRALRAGWDPGLEVLADPGRRGVDPAVVGDDVAADLTVVFREHPFGGRAGAPRVLAALVETGPDGAEPALVGEVRRSGLPAGEWLRAYLHLSLVPMLTIFARDGVGFEAHLQNSLLTTDDDGRPRRFHVRDMEGTFVSRDRLPAGLDPASPLVYDEAEAWQRLRYHAVVNQLAGVVAVLGRHLADEAALWAVVADVLADVGSDARPWVRDLVTAPTLPAKANLLSRFTDRGESPLYVDLPNPLLRRTP